VENHQATSRGDGAAIKAEPTSFFSTSVSPADKKGGVSPSLNDLIPEQICVAHQVQYIPQHAAVN